MFKYLQSRNNVQSKILMKQAVRMKDFDGDPWHHMRVWNRALEHDELLYSIRRVDKPNGKGEYSSAFGRLYNQE